MPEQRQTERAPGSCLHCGSTDLRREPIAYAYREFDLMVCMDCGHVDRRQLPPRPPEKPRGDNDPNGFV